MLRRDSRRALGMPNPATARPPGTAARPRWVPRPVADFPSRPCTASACWCGSRRRRTRFRPGRRGAAWLRLPPRARLVPALPSASGSPGSVAPSRRTACAQVRRGRRAWPRPGRRFRHRPMLPLCNTTLTVNGRPNSLTSAATASLRSCAGIPATLSAASAWSSCMDSWKWSRPASTSGAKVPGDSGIPLVTRLTYMPRPARTGDQLRQVSPQQWFSAREMHLKDAQRARLLQYPQPIARVQLVAVVGEVEGIGAIAAVQRAAVGQFGEQAEGRRGDRRSPAPAANCAATAVPLPSVARAAVVRGLPTGLARRPRTRRRSAARARRRSRGRTGARRIARGQPRPCH